MFERADINITGLGLQSEPWIQWTDPVVEPQAERREEWRIFAALAREMGLRGPLDADDPETEVWARIDHMLTGRGLSLDDVRAAPKGTVVFEDGLIPGGFYERHLQHTDGLVDCCPDAFGPASLRFPTRPSPATHASSSGGLRLISRRDTRMHNSWFSNVESLKRGARSSNPLDVNVDDARASVSPMAIAWWCAATGVRSKRRSASSTTFVLASCRSSTDGVGSPECGWPTTSRASTSTGSSRRAPARSTRCRTRRG